MTAQTMTNKKEIRTKQKEKKHHALQGTYTTNSWKFPVGIASAAVGDSVGAAVGFCVGAPVGGGVGGAGAGVNGFSKFNVGWLFSLFIGFLGVQ